MTENVQYQPRPSTVYATLQFLNSIDRVQRSQNAVDKITVLRSAETAKLNTLSAFLNNTISLTTYQSTTIIFCSIASTLGKVVLPIELSRLPQSDIMDFYIQTWTANFKHEFWSSFGIKQPGIRYDNLDSISIKEFQVKIIKELLSLDFSQTRPPRNILKNGIEVADITDVLPSERKKLETQAQVIIDANLSEGEKSIASKKKRKIAAEDGISTEAEIEKDNRIRERRKSIMDARTNTDSMDILMGSMATITKMDMEQRKQDNERRKNISSKEVQEAAKEKIWALLQDENNVESGKPDNILKMMLLELKILNKDCLEFMDEYDINAISFLLDKIPKRMFLNYMKNIVVNSA